MTVEPGFGGQKLIPETVDKIGQVKALCAERGLNVEIEADGGITPENVALLKDRGLDVAVAGSAVFRAEDPRAAVENIGK